MTEEIEAFTKDELESFLSGRMVWKYFGRTKDDNINPNKFYPAILSKDVQRAFKIITMRDNLDIYVYDKDKGIYKPYGRQLLCEIIKKVLGPFYKQNFAIDTINDITASTGENREELEPELHLIPLKNGLLNILSDKPTLAQHSPAMFFTGTLPVNYNPNAKFPKILKFLGEIIPNELERQRLQEHIGYLLYRKNIFQIAVLLIGPEDSGKSRLLEVLRRLLGKENVSSVELQDLGNDRFSAAELYKKFANVCADISKTTLRRSGKFKMLTGGDLIDAQKKYRNRFRFVNYAKLWFSANEIPETKDRTSAFFKRWDFFEFPNQFKGIRCNPNIIEEIVTPEELSRFLNWALEGLRRLLKNKKFSDLKTIEQRKEIWLLGSSSLYKYVRACIKEDPIFNETKEDFMEDYTKYCGRHGLSVLDKNVVSKELPRLIPSVRSFRPKIGKKQVKSWKGIRIVGERPPKE